MLAKLLKIATYSLLLILISCCSSYAYDPLSVPNNRVGVHILDPQEITTAAKLVNSSSGDWGYVTVPMRANDRDRDTWLKFFAAARQLHIIPIIRLATYPNDATWVRPTVYDLIDFANFLNDMPWPTQNRYIILFNEPNHNYEWGDSIDPLGYANLLVDAHRIFKSRSADFFLLTAGLDMSAPNSKTSMDALDFYVLMTKLKPDWYSHIDGLSVHAYPNPGFSAGPYTTNRYGISSYKYETSLLSSYGFSSKPIFISETGSAKNDDFYTPAFSQIWTDPHIAAITPFILFAGSGDFAKFSLLDPNLQPTPSYLAIQNLPKITGSPLLANVTISPATPTYSTPPSPTKKLITDLFTTIKEFVSPKSHRLIIGSTIVNVEIASSDSQRAQGLSDRPNLPSDSGMLFVFPNSIKPSFWMKDMRFPLDFIWLKSGKIINITSHVPPPSQTNNQPTILTPDIIIDQVLEVNAGFVDDHGLKIGDTVVLN